MTNVSEIFQMTNRLKCFLNDHKDLVENEEFRKLLKMITELGAGTKQEFCALLYDIGWFNTYENWFNSGITLGVHCPEHVTVPDGITSLSSSIFSNSVNLRTVHLPTTLQRIEYLCFYKSGITSISLPNNVEVIEAEAFSNCCNLQHIVLPNKIDMISWETFKNCTQLESITIPGAVRFIGRNAFLNCKNLKRITYEGTVEQWNNISIDDFGVPDNIVYCIDGKV